MKPEHAEPLFDDDAGFRQAFAKRLGGTPPSEANLRADWIPSPVGPLLAIADATHLRLLEFFERGLLPTELIKLQRAADSGIAFGRTGPTRQLAAELKAFFAGRSARFETPCAPVGTPFEMRAWDALHAIPAGETRSYGEQAAALDQPTATRAVARANGANPIAIVTPCHRIIGADGSLTGYGGGLWRKRWLLDHERQAFGYGLI
ncbi:methylated-DNA--[protein]-cysteine S-methyltransferase [Maricaulis sp.]|uniref:methylated-DNA--[protein]-cysteine S-methyltransferase n=1 Tax=Maricaulis sp. TaxID=1486257 RepID=UPI0025B90DD8|nr:methylated-DNA--[protein]-cysteine S-methyltransferase [Maricaulis sp.]